MLFSSGGNRGGVCGHDHDGRIRSIFQKAVKKKACIGENVGTSRAALAVSTARSIQAFSSKAAKLPHWCNHARE
jgi:hypothetical protein